MRNQQMPSMQQVQQPMQMGNMTNEQARVQVQQMLANNPALAQQYQQTMQQYGNMGPWDIAYELMRQRGIDPRTMGLPRR